MALLKHASYLRGFLESLAYCDTISQKQIDVLKIKLNEIISEIEEDSEPPVYNVSVKNSNKSQSTFNPSPETIDDLPF